MIWQKKKLYTAKTAPNTKLNLIQNTSVITFFKVIKQDNNYNMNTWIAVQLSYCESMIRCETKFNVII